MNIVIFTDKVGSAIHRLAESVRKYNEHFNIKVIALHPKRQTGEELFQAQDAMKWADLIDVHYWKSGEVLRTTFAQEFGEKKKILCHFNPYDLDKMIWQEIYDAVVVGNQTMQNKIPYAHLIPYGIDLNFFSFNQDYTKYEIIQMVANRIEGKKGIREVTIVCKELGYKFRLVGNVSDGPYLQSVLDVGGVEFFENVSEEQLRDSYYKSAIHICNSVGNFESGTLPILEAMACGVPVLTTNVGHVPDLFDGKNMVVRSGTVDDLNDLKNNLKEMMENRDMRLRIRDAAWKTVKNRYDKKMARQFSSLYYKVLNEKQPLVSVIIPTFDRGEPLLDCLAGAVIQDYSNYELVIADSGKYPVDAIIRRLRQETKVPVKYVRFEHRGVYTLAEARNRAILEAEGEILVFCDDRLKMAPDAVSKFVRASKSHTWLWGVKDNSAKDFIENFASIRREDLINGGIFCERIDKYGAMSQEIRTRFTKQGFAFELVDHAHAESITKSKGWEKKRADMIESKFILYKMYG